MIQLYDPKNTNYGSNGDHNLRPIKCELTMKLGDSWTLELENPIDENAKFIVDNAVISVNTPIGKNHLFIINETKKNEGTVVATAVPILLSNDGYHFDTRIVNKNGQEAGDILCSGTQIKFHSNITKRSSAYYEEMKLNTCLGGDNDNSFLNRWGGEPIYSNFDLYINERAGSDKGIRAEAGFNLTGISEEVIMTGVITRLRPKAYNGYLLPNNETVDSSNLKNYLPRKFPPTIIEYNDIKLAEDAQDGDADKGITICNTKDELYAALRERAAKEFTENKIDLPKITYEISIADISKTDKYSDVKDLVKVSLGDTVYVKNKRLNIVTSPRVTEIAWDCINEEIISLKLGDYEANFFNDVSSVTNSVNKVIDKSNDTLMANRIAGVINLLNASLRAQKDVAQRQDVRAILFEDLDTKSPTFGALCIGTQGIQIAKKRNPTNDDWVWGTAIDFQSINANYMITGILSDKNGKFYLNLDTGELRMKDGTFVGVINGATINGGNINGTNIKGSSFVVERRRVSDVRAGDPDLIRRIIMGEYNPTQAEIERLDFTMDGKINALDYTIAKNMLSGIMSKNWTDRIDINANSTYPQIEVSTTNDSGARYFSKMSVSTFIGTYLDVGSADINSIYELSSIEFDAPVRSKLGISFLINTNENFLEISYGGSYIHIYNDRITSNRTITNGV